MREARNGIKVDLLSLAPIRHKCFSLSRSEDGWWSSYFFFSFWHVPYLTLFQLTGAALGSILAFFSGIGRMPFCTWSEMFFQQQTFIFSPTLRRKRKESIKLGFFVALYSWHSFPFSSKKRLDMSKSQGKYRYIFFSCSAKLVEKVEGRKNVDRSSKFFFEWCPLYVEGWNSKSVKSDMWATKKVARRRRGLEVTFFLCNKCINGHSWRTF